jgi:DNA-binding GntR family transcriptional regulator
VPHAATAHQNRRSSPRAPSAAARDTADPAVAWAPIEGRPTLAEQVYTAVRERILAGQLAPATVVRPRDVEEMMGVSRTPVREALHKLSTEGFLEPAPRQGFRVPDLSIDDLVDLYPAVQLLEILALDLAVARIRPGDLDVLEGVNAEFAAAVGASDVTAAVDANTRFHEALAALCGNRPLCRLLEDLRLRVRRLEMLDFGELLASSRADGRSPRRDVWVKQHADIIAAMRRGQYAAARELLRKNRSLLLDDRTRQGRARPDPSAAAATSATSPSARRSAATPAASRRGRRT